MKRNKLLSTIPLWVCALLALGLPAPGMAYVEDLDSIVAVVNDDVIVRSELMERLAVILKQLQDKGTRPPPQSVLERQILERQINTRLQLQAAKRAGIRVDDATLGKAITNIAKRNGMTLSELRNVLESEGMRFDRFREETRGQIVISRLQAQQVTNRITVTDQEIKNFLTREAGQLGKRSAVHLYHILVSTPDGAAPQTIQEAKEKAERLVSELRAGADFEETALTYSDGRQALKGGDLGWRNLSEIPTIAADRVDSMERGEISDPIRTASGFHIIELVDYKGGDRVLVKQIHARHILIKTNELISDQEAKTRLRQLRLRLEGGEDFATLARSHSDDTGSAIKGGDLGWVNPGATVPAFEQQMNELEPGQISEPFRSPFGWHIVQVLERRNHDSTDELLKAKARKIIRDRKAIEAKALWERRLRDEAYVEIRLEE